MAYPIFFAFFQNILYYMYIREKTSSSPSKAQFENN